ncbi:hypothetical protein CQW23_34105 [Capsicum baccatum]|uniref:Protein TAR1 n=1 Tax=Capsicum baccatum TaxID=33114 RepID=A0A2G2UZT4_CAPBA|nr:hypothetical protein CQW23_34105 [Capsicum baccatum]
MGREGQAIDSSIPWRFPRRGSLVARRTFAGSFCCAVFNNDPSAGSPTETLLRLLLPLNDKVQWTSRDVAGSEPPTSPRSEYFTGSFNRQIAPPTKNGHAPPPIESRKSSQSVNPYYVWTWVMPTPCHYSCHEAVLAMSQPRPRQCLCRDSALSMPVSEPMPCHRLRLASVNVMPVPCHRLCLASADVMPVPCHRLSLASADVMPVPLLRACPYRCHASVVMSSV